MSELKTRYIDDTHAEYYNTGKHDLAQIYLKSEVDKYIAELEASHKKEVEELKAANGRLECELDLWRDGNIIREETLNEINTANRALCRLRVGFALHFGRVNSGKKIVAYWREQAKQYKEMK